jgi:hypothetical protein
MATRKKIELAWLLVPGIMGIFVFAAVTWLSTPDSFTDPNGVTHTITGWEVLHAEHASFFTWVWLGMAGAVIFGVLAYLNETGAWIGRYLPGSEGLTWLTVILALVCLIIPWIPALTIKTDGGQFSKPQSSLYEHSTMGRTCSISGEPAPMYYSSNDILSQGRQDIQQWVTGFSLKESMAYGCWRTTCMVWSNNGTSLRLAVVPPYQ